MKTLMIFLILSILSSCTQEQCKDLGKVVTGTPDMVEIVDKNATSIPDGMILPLSTDIKLKAETVKIDIKKDTNAVKAN